MKPSFFLLAILVSFPQLSETIYAPSLLELSKYFQTSENLMEQSLSIYFLGFALGVFIFGRLSDIYGRKMSMILGILIYTFSSAGCFYAPNIELFLSLRFIQGFGASVGSVVTQVILRDTYLAEERARVFAKIGAVLAFAPALGPFIGVRIASWFSPMASFMFLFIMGVLLLLASSTRLKETLVSVKPINIRALSLRMMKDKHIWLCGFLIAAHNGIIFSLHAEAPFILMELLRIKPSHYAFFGLALAIPFIVASMVNSRLLKTMTPYQLNALGALLMVISLGFLVMILPYKNAISLEMMRMIFLTSISFTMLGIGISLPNCLSFSLKDYQDAIGSAQAIFGLMYYFMLGGFLTIMGIIHNGSMWPLPIYFLALSLSIFFGSFKLLGSRLLTKVKL